jgi:hypothetical protein
MQKEGDLLEKDSVDCEINISEIKIDKERMKLRIVPIDTVLHSTREDNVLFARWHNFAKRLQWKIGF